MSTKVLVIEDDGSIRDSLLDLLDAEDYTARGGENGLTGLRLVDEFKPDLIICDIMMPDLDGYSVYDRLQKNPATALIPFIFLTAKADRDDQRHGMSLGADDYVTKPFTRQEILQTIERQLAKRESLVRRYDEKRLSLIQSISLALPHELRTPLSGIKTGASVIAETIDAMSLADIKNVVDIIYQSAERLEHLIVNYLAFAELEVVLNDPARLQLLRARTCGSARLVISQTARIIAERVHRETDLVLNLEDAAVRMADQHLGKLVDELVDNAFKFSTAGQPVELASQIVDDRFVLTLTDHGRGLAPEQIADIDAYMQFERKLHEQQGSGLGLTIARRLIEVYHGELTIDSVYGSRTTILIKLPLK
jgi:two-component system, sensor histidine kinase and response regulator